MCMIENQYVYGCVRETRNDGEGEERRMTTAPFGYVQCFSLSDHGQVMNQVCSSAEATHTLHRLCKQEFTQSVIYIW